MATKRGSLKGGKKLKVKGTKGTYDGTRGAQMGASPNKNLNGPVQRLPKGTQSK